MHNPKALTIWMQQVQSMRHINQDQWCKQLRQFLRVRRFAYKQEIRADLLNLHGHGSLELGRFEAWIQYPTPLLGVPIPLAMFTLQTSPIPLLVRRLVGLRASFSLRSKGECFLCSKQPDWSLLLLDLGTHFFKCWELLRPQDMLNQGAVGRAEGE